MKIVKEFPPNIDLIRNRFTLHKGIVFTFGDTIYNPDDGLIDAPLLFHETTHSVQQGDNPTKWWARYLIDDDFRFVQELEAYQNQYKKYCELNKDRNARARFLNRIATDLSSSMYGSFCKKSDALRCILNNTKFTITE